MNFIKRIIKRFKCKHEETTTITNFYGDAITHYDCRSWRRCDNCGKIIKSWDIDPKCDRVNEWWHYR